MSNIKMNRFSAASSSRQNALSTNSVLRNTYMLLSLTLLFSAMTAGVAIVTHAAPPSGLAGGLLMMGMAYGLLFLTQSLRNSAWGIVSVFAFTGFMGYILGPFINSVLTLGNGSEIVMTALGGTGLIFFALSGYALTTRKDFSFLSGFIVTGAIVLIVCMIAGIFFHSSVFQLVISALFMFLSSATILWQTGEIVNGGERNYISATVTLYVQIYNLFVSLLQILSALQGRD